MLRGKYVGVPILCLCVWADSLPAQTGGRKASPGSAVIVRSGSYQLTQEMIQRALVFGEILAGADFSPSDGAELRADLIAYFQKEPAKQTKAYESVAQWLQGLGLPGRKPSWLDLAIARYKEWQSYGDPQRFREFQSYPFGKMVLKYNPVLVNSGGMIVTKADVDCLFYSNALVAQAAGVAPSTDTDEEQFVRNLPSRFASMATEQKEQLRQAELRLVSVHIVYNGTIKTRAAMIADIKRNVHSSADVWREARQVENNTNHDT